MRRLHAHQFDADRRMGDVRAGDVAQAGHLHLVAHQRRPVFRHDHHHYFAAGFLQLIEEGVQLIEQLLRARLVVGALVGADEAVAVVQRNDVEEGGGAAVAGFLLLIQPAGQQFEIVINRFTVERRQLVADAGLRHQRCLHIALFAQLFQEVAEYPGVIEHQLFLEAELRQVVEQVTLLVHRLVQIVMRKLAAAGAQQADGRRAAVGGGRVEAVEHDVHLRPQRVILQVDRLHIGPGQRTDVDHQQIERLGVGGQGGRERGGAAFFPLVELIQVGRQVGAGRRQAVCRRAVPRRRCGRGRRIGGTGRGRRGGGQQ